MMWKNVLGWVTIIIALVNLFVSYKKHMSKNVRVLLNLVFIILSIFVFCVFFFEPQSIFRLVVFFCAGVSLGYSLGDTRKILKK